MRAINEQTLHISLVIIKKNNAYEKNNEIINKKQIRIMKQ